jgi:hypothetical protein
MGDLLPIELRLPSRQQMAEVQHRRSTPRPSSGTALGALPPYRRTGSGRWRGDERRGRMTHAVELRGPLPVVLYVDGQRTVSLKAWLLVATMGRPL